MTGIEVKNITKRYGKVAALDNVTLTFRENKIYGLLGRNGAGKSTLLNIITNRIFADSGEVVIDGMQAMENERAQRRVYLMSEQNCYPDKMKIKDIFYWSKEFYPEFDREYAMGLADKFELAPNKMVKSLSTGYASIFKVITAMSVNTPYMLLDEPVLGLDANHREMFYKELIAKYSRSPFTAVISTHLIEEVSNVIEDIIIIKKGIILKNESREQLLSQGFTVTGSRPLVEAYLSDRNVLGTDGIGGIMTAYILGECDREGLPAGLEVSALDLQSLFIKLTNS